MTLLQLQHIFSRLVIKLLIHANSLGYEVSLGEAWRPQCTALYYAKKGLGIKNSLHCDRLAIDLNLFLNGKYLTDSDNYRALGLYWESLSTDKYRCCWGGRFKDPAHYSIEYGNRK